MKHITTIPNTLIERMFYRSFSNYEDVTMYRSLIDRANQAKTQEEQDQFIGSATAFASRKVEARLYELLAVEHEMKMTVEQDKAPSIYDHPEMLK